MKWSARPQGARSRGSAPDSALGFTLGLATALLLPCSARAQSDEMQRRTTAEALFAQAKELMAKQDYERACPKLEEVNRLLPGKVGATMTLGECYETAGKLASARTVYEAAERLARSANDPRADEAHGKALALAPRVPRLAIVVAEGMKSVRGLKVERDGMEVGAPQWGDALPIDPGAHTITASAPGMKTWSSSVQLTGGSTTTVQVPAPVPEPATQLPAPQTAPAQTAPPLATAPPDSAAPRHGGTPTWAWVVGGGGVALLGAATVFGLDGLSTNSKLEDRCGATLDQCPVKQIYDPTDDNARKNRDLGLFIAFGGAGVLALGSAVITILSAPASESASESTKTGSVRVIPALSPSSGGAVVMGVF